jgi:hypothetical protein
VTSDLQVGWPLPDQCAGVWPRHDLIDGGVHRVEEFDAEVLTARLVPSCGEAVLEIDIGIDVEASAHGTPPASSAKAPGASLDFRGPGRLHVSGALSLGRVQARQQFGGHVGAFVERQREGVAQHVLRS